MITLKTLPRASRQEVFDQVARHLLTQMLPSTTRTGGCRYHGPHGLKCAAGCLISADEYAVDLEGHCWASLVDEGHVPYAHMDLICALQSIHDAGAVRCWHTALAELATEFKLSDEVLKAFPALGDRDAGLC